MAKEAYHTAKEAYLYGKRGPIDIGGPQVRYAQ